MAPDSDLTTDDEGPPPGGGPPGIGPDDRTTDITSAGGGPDSIDDIPPAAPTRPAPSAGGRLRYFGDYEIIRELARGGMGVVFLARQVSLNRTVAVKMILSGQFASEAAVARFHAEAEAAGALDHPNLVPIYETGRHDDQHYFSMKFVEGTNLAAEVPSLGADPRRAARLVATATRAVGYAHRRGVLHRDLKPANILIDTAGEPHVTDFGLAKMMDAAEGADGAGLTGTQAVMGTPSYMAPEQAAGHTRDVTTAADVYGMGAVLYETLSGKPPFREATTLMTLMKVRSDPPPRPSTINPATPADLETICLKCLEKEPGRRYASCEALADDLERWLRGEPIQARPVGPVERLGLWAKRRPAIAGLLAGLAATAIVGAVGIVSQWREAVAARRVAEARTEEVRAQTARVTLELHRSEVSRGRALMEGGHPEEAENVLWRAHFTRPRDASPAAAGALWKLYRDHPRARVFPGGPWQAMELSADGATAALVADDGAASRSISLFAARGHVDTSLDSWELNPRVGRWILAPALSPDGANIAIDNGTPDDPGPQVWRRDGDFPGKRALGRLPVLDGPVRRGRGTPSYSTFLTDDGLAFLSGDGGVALWRVRPTPTDRMAAAPGGAQGVFIPLHVASGGRSVLGITASAFRAERLVRASGESSGFQRQVLVSGPGGEARFVDVFDEPEGWVAVQAGQAALSAKARRMVTQDTTGTLTCWDWPPGDGDPDGRRAGFDPTPHLVFDHLLMNAAGTRLAGLRGISAKLFDLPGLAPAGELRLLGVGVGRLAAARMSPDGLELFAIEPDGTAGVYALPPVSLADSAATATATAPSRLPGADRTFMANTVAEVFMAVGLGPAGPAVVAGHNPSGRTGSVRDSPRWMGTFSESGKPGSIPRPDGDETEHLTADKACAVARDGSFCVVTSDGAGPAALEWHDLNDRERNWFLPLPWDSKKAALAIVAAMALVDGDRMAVVAMTGGRVFTVDLTKRAVTGDFAVEGGVFALGAPADGATIALRTTDSVTMVSIPDGTIRWRVPATTPRPGLAFSADGRRLVAFGAGRGTDLWDVPTTGGVPVASAAAGAGALRRGTGGIFLTAAFLPDGTRLVTGDDDGRMAMWDVASGDELWSIAVGGPKVMKVVPTADGRTVRFVGKAGIGAIDLARPAELVDGNMPSRLKRLWPEIAGAGEMSPAESAARLEALRRTLPDQARGGTTRRPAVP